MHSALFYSGLKEREYEGREEIFSKKERRGEEGDVY